MNRCYDAITVTLVWHQESKHWEMGWQQLTYCGEHDHRGAVVASAHALLERGQPFATPLGWTYTILEHLLHDPAQPWQPEQMDLFSHEDTTEERGAGGPFDLDDHF